MNPEVCIIESLNFFDEQDRREGQIISNALKLMGKRPHYVYVRSQREFELFLDEYGRSDYRYLHLSCHGNKKGFATTTEFMPTEDVVGMLGAASGGGRRLFVSSCDACTSAFANALLSGSDWLSVAGPKGKIRFDDAAIFWTAFYHLMFKEDTDSMTNSRIREKMSACAKLIEQEFIFAGKKKSGDVFEANIPEGEE